MLGEFSELQKNLPQSGEGAKEMQRACMRLKIEIKTLQ